MLSLDQAPGSPLLLTRFTDQETEAQRSVARPVTQPRVSEVELGARQPGSRGREGTPHPERAGESFQLIGAEKEPRGLGEAGAGQGSDPGRPRRRDSGR